MNYPKLKTTKKLSTEEMNLVFGGTAAACDSGCKKQCKTAKKTSTTTITVAV